MRSSSPSLRIAAIILLIVAMLCTVQLPVLAQGAGSPYSVSGRVYDANHNAIPGAKVTLYNTKFTLEYVATDPAKVPNNPQFTSNGSTSLTGLYQFSGLTPDVYIVTVEKNGVAFSEMVQVREGTATLDVVIPGYIEKSYSSSPTPTPAPAPTYTNVIPPVTGPMPDFGAIIFDFLKILLMLIVALQLVAGVFVIVARIGQPK